MVTNETPVGAVYRGFSIIYIGGGFELHEEGSKKETHQCADDEATKRYKSMKRIDDILRFRRNEVDASIERVDAQVKATRDSGV